MDKLDEKTNLMVYVPIKVSELNDFANFILEREWEIDLVTTKEFYEQVKFKQMSPKA